MKKILLFLFAVLILTAWTVPSYAAETTFSGAWRIRAFALDNDQDFNDDASDNDAYIDQRFRLGIKSRASDDFGGLLQLEAGNATWSTGAATVTARQAYLDFNVQNVNVKVGRQKYTHPGDIKKLVLVNVVDAVTASTNVAGNTVYGGFIKVTEGDNGAATADADADVYTIGMQASPSEGISVGGFWIYQRDMTDADASVNQHWLGANGSFKVGQIDISAEGIYLTGDLEQDTSSTNSSCSGGTAGADCDYGSYALVAEAKTSINQIGLGLVLGIGSGDDNTSDNDIEVFDDVANSGSFNITNIAFDHGSDANGGQSLPTNVGLRTLNNITVISPYVTFMVSDQLKLKGAYAWIKCNEQNATAAVAPCTVTNKDDYGSEINLQLDYTIHSASNLGLRLQANWFFPEDGIEQTTGKDDVASEYFARLQYNF